MRAAKEKARRDKIKPVMKEIEIKERKTIRDIIGTSLTVSQYRDVVEYVASQKVLPPRKRQAAIREENEAFQAKL